jgi:hypothetical protein
MRRVQPEQPPSSQAIRAELEATRALFDELAAVRLRIAKYHAALRFGEQLALVILAKRAKTAQR